MDEIEHAYDPIRNVAMDPEVLAVEELAERRTESPKSYPTTSASRQR